MAAMVTTQIQQALRALGYYDGEITGIPDEATTEAIRALQRDLGVEVTGEYDAATDAALRGRLGAGSASLSDAVTELQQLLTELGFFTGPVDGRYSTATADAVRALQRDLGVPETGLIDVATLRAIHAQGAASGPPPPPTTAPPAPTTVAATAAPPGTTATLPPSTPATPPPTEAATTVPTDAPAPAPPAPPAPPPVPPTAPPPEETAPDLFEVLSGDPRFSTFVELLEANGYDEDLAEPGPITVFAPVNGAFDAATAARLGADPAVIAFHLVTESVPSAALVPPLSLPTAYGADLEVGPGPTVGGAQVIGAELPAANGIVHAVDAVLVPPS